MVLFVLLLPQDYAIECPATGSSFSLKDGSIKEWYPNNPVLRALTPQNTCRNMDVYQVKLTQVRGSALAQHWWSGCSCVALRGCAAVADLLLLGSTGGMDSRAGVCGRGPPFILYTCRAPVLPACGCLGLWLGALSWCLTWSVVSCCGWIAAGRTVCRCDKQAHQVLLTVCRQGRSRWVQDMPTARISITSHSAPQAIEAWRPWLCL